MFEGLFQWGMRRGSRVLFVIAAAVVLSAVWQIVGGFLAGYSSHLASVVNLFGALATASLPFFCAVVLERIDLWLQRGGTVTVAPIPVPAPSRLGRWGSPLLLALSLIYFLLAALICTDLTALLNGSWIGPLWQGSVLLFGAIALDRLDRWMATVRPYSG